MPYRLRTPEITGSELSGERAELSRLTSAAGNALVSEKCVPGSNLVVGMSGGMWSLWLTDGFSPRTPVSLYSKATETSPSVEEREVFDKLL